MLFDDPFGAVDAPTAMALLERLLLGPLLKGKTRATWRDGHGWTNIQFCHGWECWEGDERSDLAAILVQV